MVVVGLSMFLLVHLKGSLQDKLAAIEAREAGGVVATAECSVYSFVTCISQPAALTVLGKGKTNAELSLDGLLKHAVH